MFYTHFLSLTDQKRAESSTYWQFFYNRRPVNFDIQRERLLKYDAKNSIYIERYHPLDHRYGFLYQFNQRLHHHYSLFSRFQKVFQIFKNLAGLWLVGEVVNHLCFMDLRRSRVARRSNVGLVLLNSGCKMLGLQISSHRYQILPECKYIT